MGKKPHHCFRIVLFTNTIPHRVAPSGGKIQNKRSTAVHSKVPWQHTIPSISIAYHEMNPNYKILSKHVLTPYSAVLVRRKEIGLEGAWSLCLFHWPQVFIICDETIIKLDHLSICR